MAFTPSTQQASGHDADRGPALLAFNIIMTIAAIAALGLRFASRLLSRPVDKWSAKLWWDDWLALAAMPFLIASAVLACLSVYFDFGIHVWDVPPHNLLIIAIIMFANCLVYDAALSLSKASVLLFYSRVFQTHLAPPWFSVGLYITHGLNVAWYIGAGLAKILLCHPTAKFWDPSKPGKCGSLTTMWLSTGIASVVIDLIILILPLPIIWNLRMTRMRKLALTVLFVCGYSVIVISIGRVVTTVYMLNSLETDITYKGIPLAYWLSAELPVTMISICLPALGSLTRYISQRCNPLYTKARSALSSNDTFPPESPLPTTERPHLTPKFDNRPVAATNGSNSARSSYLSSNYQAYAAYTGSEKDPEADGKTGVGDVNDKEIRVENSFTISSHT